MSTTLIEELEEAVAFVLDAATNEDASAGAYAEQSRGNEYRAFAEQLKVRITQIKKVQSQLTEFANNPNLGSDNLIGPFTLALLHDIIGEQKC